MAHTRCCGNVAGISCPAQPTKIDCWTLRAQHYCSSLTPDSSFHFKVFLLRLVNAIARLVSRKQGTRGRRPLKRNLRIIFVH